MEPTGLEVTASQNDRQEEPRVPYNPSPLPKPFLPSFWWYLPEQMEPQNFRTGFLVPPPNLPKKTEAQGGEFFPDPVTSFGQA